ncbi:MAG: CpaF family protein [Rhodospirillales bacterium]|jgi:pilus assembly protein CpaF|nr:CpaF family protein [Rhodospirillales bacterium]MDP6774368.1 CpaF family protein [Rhodospirillales bacterium]
MFGRRASPNVVPLGAAPLAALPDDCQAVGGEGGENGARGHFDREAGIEFAVSAVMPRLLERAEEESVQDVPRHELAAMIAEMVDAALAEGGLALEPDARRDAVTVLLNELLLHGRNASPAASLPEDSEIATSRDSVEEAKRRILPILMERIDAAKASATPRDELSRQIGDIVSEILAEEKLQLNLLEQRDLVTLLLNEMLGLGPLEPLLADETITDIMVNGAEQVYVERQGRLELSDAVFRDDAHVMNIAGRIVSTVGRRVDESSPLVDARLADGSRVNIIIPPLAIDGPTISIRKFAKKKITLDIMESQQNLSPAMASVLRIAARARLNILISGGTGSGKTTLLNALSRMIDDGERIVTIEDAAELQLQQPHVVRLETRPPNLEGGGEISQRDLVKNALRMRPDRVILGEIRAGEAFDMLQAMNTGHDGSMCTVHANRPREALTRLENMVAMSGIKLAAEAVRAQIAGAVNLIVQIARMRDGVRRITHITEVVGMEGEVITAQDLFTFEFEGENADGRLRGSFKSTNLRPNFLPRAEYFGLGKALMEAVS